MMKKENEVNWYQRSKKEEKLHQLSMRCCMCPNLNDPMNRVCPPFLERSVMKCRFIRKWRTKDLGTLQVIQEGEDFYVHSSIKGTLSSSKGSTADEVQANLNKLGVLKRLQQLSAENAKI